MANFNKAFNYRGGFQVDTDVLLVRGQNVGIGSTIPNERLVVDGIIKANGLDITSSESVNLAEAQSGILTVTEILDVGIETGSALPFPQGTPQVRLTTGIITAANPAIGVVTYYGDGSKLLNLPTSQWLDIDVGLGFTSIYAQGYVGVDTTDPRYPFQVGGVPFAPKAGFQTSQDGVGIESGAIYASGIITSASDIYAGVNISAASTVYAGNEFIGVGSNITILNADNIAIGSIGSMRYGDLIVTGEVIADNFTGLALTATNVEPTSQLVYDTGRANYITAVNRFISTEGKIAIGHNDSPTNNNGIGDVDVRVESRDSTIYSLTSDTNTARIFAGHERDLGGANGFGGLRFGGNVSGSPTSGVNDLDLVNYDIGNLNFVLHDGATSGGTVGAFRWVYGQFDSIPMELSSSGKLSLTGNLTVGESTLEVAGVSSFLGNTTIDGEVNITNNTTIGGDLVVNGQLQFSNVSIGDTINVPGVVATDNIVVGNNPDTGYTGIILKSDGTAHISDSLEVADVLISSAGIIQSSGSITAPNATFPQASVTSQLNATYIIAPGFTLSSGVLTVDTLVVNSFSGTLPPSSSDTITANSVVTNSLESNSIQTIDITSTGTLSAAVISVSSTISGSAATFNDISVSNLNASSITGVSNFGSDGIDVNTINTNGSPNVNVAAPLSVQGQLDAFGGISGNFSNISQFDTITSSTLESTANRVGFGTYFLEISVPSVGTSLELLFTDASGTLVGTVPLTFVPA